jgi:hypothetical protein
LCSGAGKKSQPGGWLFNACFSWKSEAEIDSHDHFVQGTVLEQVFNCPVIELLEHVLVLIVEG